MVLLALWGVLVGFLIGRRERPKALMASLLWFSTFHRREDSAKVPSGIRQVWRTGAPSPWLAGPQRQYSCSMLAISSSSE